METITVDQTKASEEATSAPVREMPPVDSPQAYYRPPYIGRS